MNRNTIILFLLLLAGVVRAGAQEAQKSDLQQRAEAVDPKEHIAQARSLYIHAFNDYANKGQTAQGMACAVKAAALYYKENFYKEAFDLLRRADQTVNDDGVLANSAKAALHYQATKERMQMYVKLRRSESAKEQLAIMESLAAQSGDEQLQGDLLYNKAICYYTFGQTAQGNAVFREMTRKLTSAADYDKMDQVYQTLIDNGRKSNNVSFLAQSYQSYMAWKDSAAAVRAAAQVDSLQRQIADNEASIAEKDSTLASRQAIIVGLCILAVALAAALVVGAVVLMRYVLLTRRQKKTIRLANDSNALKAKFISNISAQLGPTLRKLDSRQPQVKALLDFADHVHTLSELENTKDDAVEMEDVQVPQFCEALVEEVRGQVKQGVNLTVNAQKMTARFNKEYVTHILLHLLRNAAEYTPAGGSISLDAKKRGPHTFQFLVTDTGEGIPEEKREDVFKPFLEVRDLTMGDGLGLPICRQMALKMNGDLEIDSQFTKGTRFVLDLRA